MRFHFERLADVLFFGGFAATVLAYGVRRAKAAERSWQAFAAERGLDFVPTRASLMFARPNRINGAVGQVSFVLDSYVVQEGKNSSIYTRVRARALEPMGISSVTVYPEHFFSGLGKILGVQDIRIGDPVFDDRFMVKAERSDDARSLLEAPLRSALMEFPREVNLRVERGEVDVHWRGLELDHAVLDQAIRIVSVACGMRPPTGTPG